MTPLRLASQETTKVVTVSQFAAPRDGEASLRFAYDTIPLGLPRAHESGVSFANRSSQEGPQIGTRPPKRAPGGARDGQEILDCPKNVLQDGPKTSPVRPQRPPIGTHGSPRGPQTGPRDFQDGPGGPPNGSKTARQTPKIAPPASLQEAPRRLKDGWRWPGSFSIIHPRSQSHRT